MESRIELKITSLSSTGEGIGSFEGLKVFVEGALPEETISAEVTQYKKSYAKAKLLSILTPSSERTEPLCPLFGECGGCQMMHLQYPAQLNLKRQRVIEALKRIGGFQNAEVMPCMPSPFSLGYRNKIQLPVVWDNGKKILGLYRKNSHEVIPINRCLIQCPQGEEILLLITEKLTLPCVRYVLIRNSVFREESLVIFVTNGYFSKELKHFAEELMQAHSSIKGVVENLNTHSDNVILGPTFRILAGRPFIFETLLNKTFKISPSAFFQVNPAQTEKLYEKAIQLAKIQGGETVLDAYCGVGTLAIFAADFAKHVYGIECIPNAIADAIENARLNNQVNTTFTCGKAEDLIQKYRTVDTVFLNPPRKGCDPRLIQALLKIRPKKIIYISCDPATLARDLASLSTSYQLKVVQPFDMFPQTMHVETLVLLN
jgi:23S rRNA (uracil1939-C5)-methyltransferase